MVGDKALVCEWQGGGKKVCEGGGSFELLDHVMIHGLAVFVVCVCVCVCVVCMHVFLGTVQFLHLSLHA